MQASTYENILAEVERMDGTAEWKRQVVEILRRNAAIDGLTIVDRVERVNFARQLLGQGVLRPVIIERLTALYGINKSTAYRDICKALDFSRIEANFAKARRLNGT